MAFFGRQYLIGSATMWYHYTRPIRPFLLEKNTYIPNNPLESAIEQSIRKFPFGVRVLFAPPDLGKTTAITNVCSRLQKEKTISGVLIPDFKSVPSTTHLHSSFMSQYLIGTHQEVVSLNKYLPLVTPGDSETQTKPIVVILDQMDEIMDNKSIEKFIVNLALESQLCKKFVVLAVVREKDYAEEILKWNGMRKIIPVGEAHDFRWKDTMISKLVKSMCNNRMDDPQWKSDKVSASIPMFTEIAVATGTPGFVIRAFQQGPSYICDRNLIRTDADTLINAWKHFYASRIKV